MATLLKVCKADNCNRTLFAIGVCTKHYTQEKKLMEFSKLMHPANLAKRRHLMEHDKESN
jgi:hypothetical protein